MILNCFILGLHPKICFEIAISQPTLVSQAIGLAKLVESKIKDVKPRSNCSLTPYTTSLTPNPPQTTQLF